MGGAAGRKSTLECELPLIAAWLNRPLSQPWCIAGWCAATALFVGVVGLLGGPGFIDTRESVYGTWATAHGHLSCLYPSVSIKGEPPLAPLYLLLSGGIGAIAHVGHSVPFPSGAALGPNCDRLFIHLNHWSIESGALTPTTWIGFIGWVPLLAGVVAWLRASGRGRCGWEPATLIILALLPPVWMCVQSYFHPQDLLAMGLGLCAMACALQGYWIAAGILVGLSVLSQQFALLVAVPLFVLTPTRQKVRYAGAALAIGAVVAIPLMVVTSGNALRAIALGTGDSPSVGGTVLWELHLYGAPMVLLSRVVPLALSAAIAWWASRDRDRAILDPVILMCVIAASLAVRLVFEQNLFSYYFMALTVSLVLVDVTRGRLRSSLAAWLAAVALVFCIFGGPAFGFVRWGWYAKNFVPFLIVVPALLIVLIRLLRGAAHRNMLPWLAVGICAILMWPSSFDPLSHGLVTWSWQIALVIPGVFLAVQPLIDQKRSTQCQPGQEVPAHSSIGKPGATDSVVTTS